MKKLANWGLVIAAIGGSYTWLSSRPAKVEMDIIVVQPELTEPAERGKLVFQDICAACHGVELKGSETGPPLIYVAYRPAFHADYAITLAIKNGVVAHHWRFGNMPPQPEVAESEIGGIIAYIREMQRANGVE